MTTPDFDQRLRQACDRLASDWATEGHQRDALSDDMLLAFSDLLAELRRDAERLQECLMLVRNSVADDEGREALHWPTVVERIDAVMQPPQEPETEACPCRCHGGIATHWSETHDCCGGSGRIPKTMPCPDHSGGTENIYCETCAGTGRVEDGPHDHLDSGRTLKCETCDGSGRVVKVEGRDDG